MFDEGQIPQIITLMQPHRQHEPRPLTGVELNSAPVRVEKALEVLQLIARKQAKSAIASHGGSSMDSIQVIEGTPLRQSEENLIDNAAHFLSGFFRDEPTEEELLRLKGMARVVNEKKAKPLPPEGTILNCPNCTNKGRVSHGCGLCKGNGTVVVVPIEK